MQFIQNKISIGKTKSFEDICQEYVAKKNASVKTASTEVEVKVAEADEAEGSGQLKVEPLHQTGESTNQDSVAGGKSDGDGGKAPAKKADEEGEDSGQPKAEGSEKFTNDPKVDTDAGSDTKVKVAEAECDECKCDPCTCKEAKADEDEEKEAKTDEDEEEVKEAGVKGNCSKCSKPNFLCKCDKGDSDDGDDDDDSKEKEDKESSAKTSVKVAFTKIANLTPAEKTRLGTYWKNIYPDAFVDALLADK